MKFLNRWLSLATLLALFASTLLAQGGLTGSLSGVVTQDGAPIAGVTVTIASPQLQGERSTVTNDAGGYNFGALPPGDYTVRFALAGLQTQTRRVHVGVAQSARADASLAVVVLEDTLTVTAAPPAVAETNEVQTNFTGDLVEALPIPRTLAAITTLSPGVTVNGPNNALMISGGQSFDNLITVNGAVVQENLRGQPHNLFIEDAIQETTVQTAGVSAEFGNFTGGVVNAITRSGGNELSGSFRDSLTNPSWTEKSPFRNPTTGAPQSDPIDKTSNQYEATLGGRIVRDRLWFFLAGRHSDQSLNLAFANSQQTYTATVEDRRLEVKLTGAITPQHTLVGSHLRSPQTQTNNCQGGCFDATSLVAERELPNDFTTVFYNGIITSSFLVEAKYSEKNFSFVRSGGTDRNLASGTPILLAAPGFASYTNEPQFCGVCSDEERNNDQYGLKGNYFLGTRALGNHNIVAGVERWAETRLANNYQSPTDYRLVLAARAPTRDANGVTRVSLVPGNSGSNDFVVWFPIEQQSLGSDLNTTAYYLNDKWDLGARWQFNLGVRYDRNDSKDSAGNLVADDAKLSPRLGATWDAFANGLLRVNATYGTYVGRLAENIASGASAAGTPLTYAFDYQGPALLDVTAEEAAAAFFDWFNANGGTTRNAWFASIPGFNQRMAGTLDSTSVDEYSFGVSTQRGNGYLRADYINRDWRDFYGVSANRNLGTVTNALGQSADLRLISNTNDLVRTYEAVQLQGQYRLLDRVNLGANYTWSELAGNITGETANSGPVTTGTNAFYPEYFGFAQNNPVGFLPQDQTHKLRAWAGVDFATAIGTFNVSVLERFDSGTPYSLVGTINVGASANFYGTGQAGGVTNPGYVTPQTTVNYFFSDRGAFRFDDLTATDVALNYSTRPGWLAGASVFAQAEVVNVFDEAALINHDVSILTHVNDSTLRRFNPLAGDAPVEGVHWRRGPNFGKATNPTTANAQGDYQLPRTYRFSLGVRF